MGQGDTSDTIPADIVALLQRGATAWREQRYEESRMFMEQALSVAHAANNAQGVMSARHMLANIAFNQCDDAKSRALHEELLAECRAMNFAGGIASSLANLALIDIVESKFDGARAKYEEAIRHYEAGGHRAEADGCRQALEDFVVQRKPLNVPRVPREVNADNKKPDF